MKSALAGITNQHGSQQASQPVTGTLANNSATSEAGTSKATSKAVGNKLVANKTTSYAGDLESEQQLDAQKDEPEELQSAESESVAPQVTQATQPTSQPLAPPAMTAQPQAIIEAPGANWYVRPPAGGQYGPAPANIFCEWLTENRVTRDSLVWRDGWPQWLVAGDIFSDYFGPAVPQNLVPDLVPGPAATPVLAPEQPAAPEFVAPLSLSDRALAARKRQRKKNYMIMIAILATISIGLVVALVLVLMKNS